MKYRLLLLMSLVSISLMTISCSLFGGDDEGKGGIDQIRFNIETELIAGQTMRVSMVEGSSQFKIKEMSINGMKLENLNESMGSSEHRYTLPADLQGAYKLMAKVQSYNDKDEPVIVEAGNVIIHKFLGDVYPGVAYRVDLSDSHTVLCTASSVEPTDNEPFDRVNHQTLKFATGQAPVKAKFYDVKGTEVPATFTSIKDISEELFFAMMCNARPRDPYNASIGGDGLFFDQNTFTCEIRMENNSEFPVVVSKKTGIISVLEQDSENTNAYISTNSEFQSMSPGIICFGGSSYGGEFTTSKLHTFDASNTLEVSEKQDQLDESFQYRSSIKLLEGQENLDILNGWDAHWLAINPGKVLFNRERMLSGNLSSIQLPNEAHTIFGVYSEHGFYGIRGGMIVTTNNIPLTDPKDGVSIVDIFQFQDSTLVRSRSTHHEVGETINHYSFKKSDHYLYKEKVKDVAISYDVPFMFFPMYPCLSNYEYICMSNNYNTIYRRPIKAIYGANETKVVFTNAPTSGLLGSASKNAITFVSIIGENGIIGQPGADSESIIREIGPQGDLVQVHKLDKGVTVTGLCRFKD